MSKRDENLTNETLGEAFEFLQALYYDMPVEEYYSDKLDRIVESMDEEAMEFFAAVTAATVFAIKVMPDETRVRYFAAGEVSKDIE